MTSYYKHIYTSLRSAMIDRDMGDKEEEAVLVDFVSGQIALKPSVPSAALLVSYSMLFYPNWLNQANPEQNIEPVAPTIEDFLGGANNPKFPLLFNVHLGMIAAAIGVYAGLWKVQYSHVLRTILIQADMAHPLVRETYEQIKREPNLTYSNARELFIELMQQEEYAQGIYLADDFIANASFIKEAEATAESTAQEIQEMQSKSVDLSAYFKGAKA
jgi:hypothetical protein